MSIWDSISDGWDWVRKTGGTIGGALSAANSDLLKVPGVGEVVGGIEKAVNPSLQVPGIDRPGAPAPKSGNYLTQQADQIVGVAGFNKSLLDQGVGKAQEANKFVRNVPYVGPVVGFGEDNLDPFKYVNPAMNAAIKGVDTAFIVQNPFDKTDWRNSWNKADSISLGQAVATDFFHGFGDTRPGISDFSMDPAAVAARKQYYENTTQGRLESGVIDLIVQVKQPLAKAGEMGVTVARDATTLSAKTGAEELGNALKVQRGEMEAAQGTRRANRFAKLMDDIARNQTNGTAAEIFNNAIFKRAGIAGSIAPLLADANKIENEADRVAFKMDILGAAYGNAGAWQRLAARRPDIAAEVNNFRSAPMPNLAANYGPDYMNDPNTPVAQANPTGELAPETLANQKQIEARLARLNNFMSGSESAQGGFGQLTSFKPQWRDAAYARVLDSDILGGIGSRPIRVVTTSIMNRVPGGVATKDVAAGASALQNVLRQSYWTDKKTRDQILDKYLMATNPGERESIIEDAVKQYNRDIANQYGLSVEDADYILAHGIEKKRSYLKQAMSRLYSASPDAKTIEFNDPETGVIQHVARPLMESQIADHVSVPDPRQLDRAYRDLTETQLVDHVLGARAGEVFDWTANAANTGLAMMTQVWKNAQLMQLRYAARVQVDSQMRNAIYMSSLPYMHAALVATPRVALGKKGVFAFMNKGDDRVKMSQLLKGDATQFQYNYMKMMGVPPEEIPDAIRQVEMAGADFHALMNTTTDRVIANARATGQWGPTDWDHPNYFPNYDRAINLQVRNSATAKAILQGHDGDSLWALTKKDPDIKKEWASLSGAYQGDKAQWLSRLEAAVHHLVPTEEARVAVLQRDITRKDIEEWYPNGDGPTVHGESYWPSDTRSPFARTGKVLTSASEHWYKMMSDAPDAYLARVQLYTYEYQKNFQRITAQVLREQNSKGLDSIDPELLNNIRKTAGKVARKRVADNLWNLSKGSNLSHTFRFVSPFFSAWEDTMRAYSGILYEKPWEMVYMNNAWNAPNNHGWIGDENGNTIDAQGNHVAPNGKILDPNIPAEAALIGNQSNITMPLSWLPKVLNPGDVKQLSINKDSLNLVFQGDPWWLPGTGPIVQYPVNELVKHWWARGENNALVKLVMPFGVQNKDGNFLDDATIGNLPPYLRDGIDALTHGAKWQENNKNALALQQAEIDAGKRTDLDPDAAAHQATWMLIMQAGADNASPIRVQGQGAAQFYVDMYHSLQAQYPSTIDQAKMQQYVDQYGQKVGPLMYKQDNPDADAVFLKQFPDFFALTASLSTNDTGIVANFKTVDDYKALKPVVDRFPEFGWAIVGPDNQYGQSADTAFSQAANDYLKMSGARGGQDARSAVERAEANKGWIFYNQGMTQLRLSLESRGLNSFSVKGADDLQQLKTKFEENLAAEIPAWGRDFGQTDGAKAVALLDTYTALARMKPQTTQRGDVQAVQQYIEGRAYMQQQLNQRAANGGASTLRAKANADLAQAWDKFTGSLIQGNIGFEMAFNRVLQNDDLSGVVK